MQCPGPRAISESGLPLTLPGLGPGPYTNNAYFEHYPTHAHLHLLPTLKINIRKCVDNPPSFHNKANGVVRMRVFLKFKKSLYPQWFKLLHLEMGLYFSNLSSNTQKTRACKLLDVQGQHNRKLKKEQMKMDVKSNVIDNVTNFFFIDVKEIKKLKMEMIEKIDSQILHVNYNLQLCLSIMCWKPKKPILTTINDQMFI